MIHLFSCNFLFAWMMEHCREDKVSLLQSLEITKPFLLHSTPRPLFFIEHKTFSQSDSCWQGEKLNFPILPSINLIWYKSRSLIQFQWIYCLFVYKDQDAEVIPKNKWIKSLYLRMTNITFKNGSNKNVLFTKYSNSCQVQQPAPGFQVSRVRVIRRIGSLSQSSICISSEEMMKIYTWSNIML